MAKRARKIVTAKAIIEALERRTLLSDLGFVWKGGDGNWSDPSKWNHTTPTPPEMDRNLPSGEDTVAINSGVVTNAGGQAKTLILNSELQFGSGAGLGLYGNLTLGGTLSFVGAFSGLSFENGSNPMVAKTFSIGGSGTIAGLSAGSLITTGGGAAT